MASNNSPSPGPKGWTCPRGCPGGMVTSKIEPCIKASMKSKDKPSNFLTTTDSTVLESLSFILGVFCHKTAPKDPCNIVSCPPTSYYLN